MTEDEQIEFQQWCFVCGQEVKEPDLPCADCAGMGLAKWAQYIYENNLNRAQLAKNIELARNQVKRLLEEPKTVYAGPRLQVAWRRYDREQLDGKKLKADCPEVHSKYCKTTQVDAVFIDAINR